VVSALKSSDDVRLERHASSRPSHRRERRNWSSSSITTTSPARPPLANLVLGSELEGHCHPGSHDPGDASGQLFPFGCLGNHAFAWGERAMEFFLAHPRE
jgi:hypothetical protein